MYMKSSVGMYMYMYIYAGGVSIKANGTVSHAGTVTQLC